MSNDTKTMKKSKCIKRAAFTGIALGIAIAVFAQFPQFFGRQMPGGGRGFSGMGHQMPGGPGHGQMPEGAMPGFGGMPGFGAMPGFGDMGDMGGMFQMNASEGPELKSKVDFKSSNLPIIKIDTKGQSITTNGKITATMQIIDNGSDKRNNISDKATGYDGQIGIKLRGNSSVSFEQKRYTIETRDESGKDIDVSLLGMPAESDWVLLAPYNDISMLRDILAFSLWNQMGHWGPHTRLCELTMNGSYRGVYILAETIKRSPNRLDIAKLRKDDVSGREVTGGYILRIDAVDGDELTFRSTVRGVGNGMMGQNVTWTVYSPKKEKIAEEQLTYIQDYIGQTEKSIQNSSYSDKDKGYAKYINIPSFVDYFIHTEVSLNADGLKRSAYFHKKKQNEDGTGGKLNAGPVWDYNLAFGNCSFCNAGNIKAWVYDGCETNPTPAMWKRLSQDPGFMALVKERYTELRKGILSDKSLFKFIDDYAELLSEAQKRHFTQFSDLLQTEPQEEGSAAMPWFMPMGGGMGGNGLGWFSAYTVSSYQEEIATLKQWLSDRLAFLDANWLR